jgi:hypothetical protein
MNHLKNIMKRILIFSFFLMGWVAPVSLEAQIRLGISFNIGSQPVWGPVGYDYAQYYYMPDIDVYYNVSQRQYIYLQSGRWRFSSSLPYRVHIGVEAYYKCGASKPIRIFCSIDFKYICFCYPSFLKHHSIFW